MFSKIANILTNLVTVRFEGIMNSAISSGIQNFLQKGRQTLLVIILSFILSVLLSAGIIISLLEATSQLDIEGITYFSAMLTWSLILSALSLLGLIIIFWPKNSIPSTKVIQASTTVNITERSHSILLEELIAALITEGIQYLKEKSNERPTAHAKDYSPT